ncbi:MAG TPA: TetR/AcrR family transcriptional regulator [Solirubrobacteraceae bacterium]|nr:TetR/AcrR family transcriptional regulator [Solirubrobacteraceae bacterium]
MSTTSDAHGFPPHAEGPPAARSRSTRGRPAKSPLSAEAIVDAALEICREEALDAVTMRRVAAELDTGPASLYVYVRNREELLRQMLDRVSGDVALEEIDPARWREQVHDLLERWLRAMEAYPGLASVAVGNPPATERMMVVADHLLGLLLAGGVTPQDAAWGIDILPLITTATAVETDVHRALGHTGEETVERIQATLSAMSPDRLPNLLRYGEELVSGDGDQRFHFAIEVFLAGLVARGSG